MAAKAKTYQALRSFSYRPRQNANAEEHVDEGQKVSGLPGRVEKILLARGDVLEEVAS